MVAGSADPNPDAPSSSPEPTWLKWLGPVLVLVLVAAWLGPALPRLGSHLLGVEYVDHYGTQWFYWYAGQVLSGAQSIGHTDLFFYPWGKDIYGHTGSNLVDAFLAWPLLKLLGNVAGYNVFVVVIVATNLWGAARLAGRFTDSALARWTAGALFALQPYVVNELVEGRPTQALLLFALLFTERLLRLRDRKSVV